MHSLKTGPATTAGKDEHNTAGLVGGADFALMAGGVKMMTGVGIMSALSGS